MSFLRVDVSLYISSALLRQFSPVFNIYPHLPAIYRSYGSCLRSPHQKHQHITDEKHCEYCGSTSYGSCLQRCEMLF